MADQFNSWAGAVKDPSSIECPFCGALHVEPKEDWKYEDGETKIFKCDTCERDFKITVDRPIYFEYFVRKEEEDFLEY